MLWLIDVSQITNESFAPQYFEYRYGVEAEEAKRLLVSKGFAVLCGPLDTLPLLSAEVIKRLLKQKDLPLSGKKGELLQRVLDHFTAEDIAAFTPLRRYRITEAGKAVLKKHFDVIERHGMKKGPAV